MDLTTIPRNLWLRMVRGWGQGGGGGGSGHHANPASMAGFDNPPFRHYPSLPLPSAADRNSDHSIRILPPTATCPRRSMTNCTDLCPRNPPVLPLPHPQGISLPCGHTAASTAPLNMSLARVSSCCFLLWVLVLVPKAARPSAPSGPVALALGNFCQ